MKTFNQPDSLFETLGQEVAKIRALVERVSAGQAREEERDFLVLRRLSALREDDAMAPDLAELGIPVEPSASADADDARCPLDAWVGCDRAGFAAAVASLRSRDLVEGDERASLTAAGDEELKRLYRLLVDVVEV